MTDITEPRIDEGIVAEPESSTEAGPDEGDIAADYLEELLDLADLDGDIEIATRAGRV
ncbi:MAG: hypothetical protein K2X36_10895 [Microbacteriaceae bacterium]|nr:hypothetical protein [Microbacteriaceae bacterium]